MSRTTPSSSPSSPYRRRSATAGAASNTGSYAASTLRTRRTCVRSWCTASGSSATASASSSRIRSPIARSARHDGRSGVEVCVVPHSAMLSAGGDRHAASAGLRLSPAGTAPAARRRPPGSRGVVRRWYASYPPYAPTTRRHSSARSSPTAVRAIIARVRPPTVSSTSGCATRLRYHSGWRSSPPREATSTIRERLGDRRRQHDHARATAAATDRRGVRRSASRPRVRPRAIRSPHSTRMVEPRQRAEADVGQPAPAASRPA